MIKTFIIKHTPFILICSSTVLSILDTYINISKHTYYLLLFIILLWVCLYMLITTSTLYHSNYRYIIPIIGLIVLNILNIVYLLLSGILLSSVYDILYNALSVTFLLISVVFYISKR